MVRDGYRGLFPDWTYGKENVAFGNLPNTNRQRDSLFWISGSDSIRHFMGEASKNKVINYYAGFESGIGYFNFNLYQSKKPVQQRALESSHEDCYLIQDSESWCQCQYPGIIEESLWDPRCRPWYMQAVKLKSRKVILSDPYTTLESKIVSITFAKYVNLESMDAVVALDLNPEWGIYDEILSDQDFLDHYFLVNTEGKIIHHSLIDNQKLNQVMEIDFVEFNLDFKTGTLPSS